MTPQKDTVLLPTGDYIVDMPTDPVEFRETTLAIEARNRGLSVEAFKTEILFDAANQIAGIA